MSKTITAALLADIQNNVTTLATLVEIKNQVGNTIRITNHDSDITYINNVYSKSTPFTVGAISHGSQMSVDNCKIELFADGSNVVPLDFQEGLYDKATVTISLVDFEDPSGGQLVTQRGWVGSVDLNEVNIVKLEIYGLLKVLDFKVGHVYQPSCDADLGDNRCKLAIDFGQALSAKQKYHVGQWVYAYDEAQLTAIPVVNPGFEADGAAVASGAAINGWTRSSNSDAEVATVVSGKAPDEGTYLFKGGTTNPGVFLEQFVTQDIDIGAAITTAKIDAGDASILFRANGVQAGSFVSNPAIAIEILDSTGKIIDSRDTHFVDFNDKDEWRPLSLGFTLIAGARTARIYLKLFSPNTTTTNAAIDNVRLHWWDLSAGTPYDGVIHKVVRITDGQSTATLTPSNPSFQADGGVVPNTNTNNVSSWVKAGYWQVAANIGGQGATDGTLLLAGGDDASGVQKTYSITQSVPLASSTIDTARVDLGKITGIFKFSTMWGDNASAANVTLDFLNAADASISLITVLPSTVKGAAVTENKEVGFVIPTLCRKIKITLFATSPLASSQANIGYDALGLELYDSERPSESESTYGVPNAGTVYSRASGSLTLDGQLIMKARQHYVQYDVVASLTSNKKFKATSMVGVDGTFTATKITWITGNNKGKTNLVRLWTSASKEIKLYFDSIKDIQVGDKFEYIFTCNKRFQEDCVIKFDNALNFRGFPHLPGRISDSVG